MRRRMPLFILEQAKQWGIRNHRMIKILGINKEWNIAYIWKIDTVSRLFIDQDLLQGKSLVSNNETIQHLNMQDLTSMLIS